VGTNMGLNVALQCKQDQGERAEEAPRLRRSGSEEEMEVAKRGEKAWEESCLLPTQGNRLLNRERREKKRKKLVRS